MHTNRDGSVKQEFADLLARLADDLGTTISETRIRDYAAALRDLSFPQVRRAAGAALRECKFFPQPVELLRLAGVPTADDRALVMWSTLRHAAAVAGAYVSVDIDDSAAAAALSLVFGSWPEFCAAEEGPALAHRRQEFLAAYRVAAAQRVKGASRMAGLLPAPPPDVAEHTWVARIEGSVVQLVRDRPQLESGRDTEAKALPPRESGAA